MQVELLNRRRWTTRIELATAIHDYIKLFHNTRRRHSALGMLTPIEAEARVATAGYERSWLRPPDPGLVDETLTTGLSDRRVEIDR